MINVCRVCIVIVVKDNLYLRTIRRHILEWEYNWPSDGQNANLFKDCIVQLCQHDLSTRSEFNKFYFMSLKPS